MQQREGDQDVGVGCAEAEPRRHVADDDDAGLGVVTRPALAHVVQQATDEQQVGSRHAPGERRGVGGALDEVPVDGETVDGIALRPAAYPGPVGQQALDQAGLIQGLPSRDGRMTGTKQRDQRIARLLRPWHWHRGRRRGQALDSVRRERGTANLIQAQRDFFGAHGFERIDGPGDFHGPWGAGQT